MIKLQNEPTPQVPVYIRMFTWEPGLNIRGADRTNAVISSWICCYVYMKLGRFSSRHGQAGSRHSRGNIYYISSSSRDEQCPVLLKFFLNCGLVCLTFLRNSLPELPEIRFSQSLRTYYNTCTWRFHSKWKYGFSITLLTWQQYIPFRTFATA